MKPWEVWQWGVSAWLASGDRASPDLLFSFRFGRQFERAVCASTCANSVEPQPRSHTGYLPVSDWDDGFSPSVWRLVLSLPWDGASKSSACRQSLPMRTYLCGPVGVLPSA
jgi:hypothetical protein